MNHWYKDIIILFALVLPFSIIWFGNQFSSWRATLVRFIAAVLSVWLFVIITRYIVVYVDMRLAETQEQINEIADGDGAKNAFALLFGWVYGIVLSAFAWFIARVVFFVRRRIWAK